MLAPSETIAARAVLYAVEDFMKAARLVTRRSLHKGAELDSARYQWRKTQFARAKNVLLNAIEQINPNSELARNIEKLFSTPGFLNSAESALAIFEKPDPTAVLKQADAVKMSGLSDAVKMSGLSSETEIFAYETDILRRFNFDEVGISRLIQQDDNHEQQ
jgi:hypothetical protein